MVLPSKHQPTDSDRQRVNEAMGALLLALDTLRDPLHRLDLATEAVRSATYEQTLAARACRDAAVPWQLIADAADLNSKQAAQARWGK